MRRARYDGKKESKLYCWVLRMMKKGRAFLTSGYAMSRKVVVFVLLEGFFWVGCQSTAPLRSQDAHLNTSLSCAQIAAHINFEDRINTLRDIYQAFSAGCDEMVIIYGTQAQEDYKYKTFRVLKEASNIFLLKLLFAVLFLASLNIREAEPNWAAIYNHGELLVGFKKNLIFFILCIFHYKVSKELSIFKFKN